MIIIDSTNGITFPDGTVLNHSTYASNSNNSLLVMNDSISANVTIPSNSGAFAVGPLAIQANSIVIVGANSRMVVL